MRVVVITPPEPVVSLDEAKVHLRADGSDEDALIAALVAAAQGHIDAPDGWLGRAIGVQTLEAYLPAPCFDRVIELPFPPVVEIEAIDARTNADWAAIDPGVYELRGAAIYRRWHEGQVWPTWLADPEAVRVRYQAGYADVPAPIRAAILLMVGDLYAARESFVMGSVAQVPMSVTVQSLLAPYRVYR